jgi:hypothetical protein
VKEKEGEYAEKAVTPVNRRESTRMTAVWAGKSMWIFGVDNPLRSWCMDTCRQKWFGHASTFVIFVNCIFLCLADPLSGDCSESQATFDALGNPASGKFCPPDAPTPGMLPSSRNYLIQSSDIVFTVLFTIEMVIKVIAMGFVWQKNSYFRDSWNKLDFVVVVAGYISLLPSVKNMSALRTFRLLRPLKTLNSIDGMKTIVTALLSALPQMGDVCMLAGFFFFIFGIIGNMLFSGTMDGRCMLAAPGTVQANYTGSLADVGGITGYVDAIRRDTGVATAGNVYDPLDEASCSMWHVRDWPVNNPNGAALTSSGPAGGRRCDPVTVGDQVINRYCARYSGSQSVDGEVVGNRMKDKLSFGTGSFDNIGVACLSIFTSITLEGWVDIMYWLFDSNGYPVLVAVFFVFLIMFGSFFMLNLALAVIEENLGAAEDAEEAEALELAAEQAALDEKNAAAKSANGGDAADGDTLSNNDNLVVVKSHTPGIKFIRNLISSPEEDKVVLFEHIMTAMIVGNTIVLAVEHAGQSAAVTGALTDLNQFFTVVFILEMVTQMLGYGLTEYFNDSFRCFDCLVVLFSVVELVMTALQVEGTDGISALRAFRLFRVFKLAKTWTELNDLLNKLSAAIKGCRNAAIVLLIMVFIFVLLGMQLFGNKFGQSNPEAYGGDLPRHHFDTFWWSFVTVFQVLTGENWNEVLYNAILGTGWTGSVVYFVVLNVLGNYVIFNLFMAIVFSQFDGDDDEEEDEAEEEEALEAEKEAEPAKALEAEKTADGPPGSGNKPIQDHSTYFTYKKDDKKNKTNVVITGNSLFFLPPDNPFRVFVHGVIHHGAFDNFILGLIGVSSVLLALDMPGAGAGAGEATGTWRAGGPAADTLALLNSVLVYIFIAEMLLKWVALGVVLHPGSYWRNSWNALDGAIVACSIVELAFSDSQELKSLRALRALRALRPLRVISRYPNLKLVVNSIFLSLPKIAYAALVTGLFFVIFGVIGVQNWKGGLNYCNDPARICKPGKPILSSHPGLLCGVGEGKDPNYPVCLDTNDFPYGTGCQSNPHVAGSLQWTAQNDALQSTTGSLAHGNLTTVNAGACEGHFFASVDADTCDLLADPIDQDACTSLGYCDTDAVSAADKAACKANFQGRFKIQRAWTSHPQNFDHVGHAVLSVFEVASGEMWPDIMYTVVDIVGEDQPMHQDQNRNVAIYFIAVTIVCAFLLLNMFVGIVVDEYNHHKESGITEEQRAWIETQTKALRLMPSRRVRRPAQAWRRPIFEMVEGPKFELTIMACILLNIVSMAMAVFDETETMRLVRNGINIVFVAIFTVEAVVKAIGLGVSEYFVRGWNQFDFTIVILSLLGVSGVIGSSSASLLRVFRVARIFRLVNTNPGLRKLFKTLVFSFPYISNVAGVMGLLFFIYAVVGMNVFGTVKYGGNLHGSPGANFETFQSAMLLLFRMTTGESYNGVMHDASIQPPFCSHTTEAGTDNCGSPTFAPIYFVSFLLFSDMLLMNILVAIILDEFGERGDEEMYNVKDEDLESFKAAWEEFDPQATGFMRCDQMIKLIASLESPLGSRPSTEDRAADAPEVVYGEEQIMAIKRHAKIIFRTLSVPTSRVPDPAAMGQEACCLWAALNAEQGKVTDCVAFHEVLSGLCGRSSSVDLDLMQSLSAFTDLVARKNQMPAIKKAVKASKRNAFNNQDGNRFTCQEVSAALLVEATWRGRNVRLNVKKNGTQVAAIAASAAKV